MNKYYRFAQIKLLKSIAMKESYLIKSKVVFCMRQIQELSLTREIRCMILAEVIFELNSIEFKACEVCRIF